jgi:hypothetical protein
VNNGQNKFENKSLEFPRSPSYFAGLGKFNELGKTVGGD